MGYLIQPVDIFTKTVIIPDADVQVMDVTPYTILQGTIGTIQCISLSVKVLPGGGAYINFNHLYLLDSITGAPVGIYDENASAIGTGYNSFLILNMKHPPNVFGAYSKDGGGLLLKFAQTVSGFGDLQVSFQYRLIR